MRILESHNGLTGLIAEHTKIEVNGQEREFDGMWASSLTDSTSKGKPDIEAVDLTTRLHDLNDTLEVTTKPVILMVIQEVRLNISDLQYVHSNVWVFLVSSLKIKSV